MTHEPVGAVMTAAPTLTDLLDWMFPDPAAMLRIILAESGGEKFFSRRNPDGVWLEQNSFIKGDPPLPLDALLRMDVPDRRMSLAPWATPNSAGGRVLPLAALWTTVKLTTVGAAPGVQRLVLESEVRARQRLAALAPTALLHEGNALTALYRLAAPLDDLPRARRVLLRLAVTLAGAADPIQIDPYTATLGCLGVKTTSALPARPVTAL
jgi:hypothetical protein